MTICAVLVPQALVPQALAYGQLAGLSPVAGLYATLAPLVLYPLFASSRQLMVGPESGLAILTALSLAPLAAEGSARFAVLAAMLALLTGALLILSGLARLGFLADFFSRPVLLGLINGVAVIIIVSQLPQLLGVTVDADSTLGTLWRVVTHIGDAQWRTIALGAAILIVLALMRRFAPRFPCALAALVLGAVAVSLLQLESKGVAIIGAVPAGLPGFSVPKLSLGDIGTLVPLAGGLAFRRLCAIDPHRSRVRRAPRGDARRQSGTRGARSGEYRRGSAPRFPLVLEPVAHRRRRDRRDTNAAGTDRSRAAGPRLSAVAHRTPARCAQGRAGCNHHLRFYRALRRPGNDPALSPGPARVRRRDRHLQCGRRGRDPHSGVPVSGPPDRADIAPTTRRSGSGRRRWRLPRAPGGEPSEAAPGVVVYRFDAPLFFANADYFVDHAIKVFDRAGPERFVLDFEAVTLVDVTAARALKRLLSEIESREAELSVARASRAVHQQMDEAGLVDAISESRFYPSVRLAVRGTDARRRRSSRPSVGDGT